MLIVMVAGAGASAGQADDKLSTPPRKLIKSEARVVDGKVRKGEEVQGVQQRHGLVSLTLTTMECTRCTTDSAPLTYLPDFETRELLHCTHAHGDPLRVQLLSGLWCRDTFTLHFRVRQSHDQATTSSASGWARAALYLQHACPVQCHVCASQNLASQYL
jgi:hypothetical protein